MREMEEDKGVERLGGNRVYVRSGYWIIDSNSFSHVFLYRKDP
jgi:hypothetical protein